MKLNYLKPDLVNKKAGEVNRNYGGDCFTLQRVTTTVDFQCRWFTLDILCPLFREMSRAIESRL
jgi:hypothetical protein